MTPLRSGGRPSPALAGISRETTTEILNEYAEQGLLSLGRGRIGVLDLDRMQHLSGS